MWFKTPATMLDGQSFLSKGTAGTYGTCLGFSTPMVGYNGHLKHYNSGFSGNWAILLPNQWYFVAMVVSAEGSCVHYVGMANNLGYLRRCDAFSTATENGTTILGAMGNGQYSSPGTYAEFKAWNRALTPAQLIAEMTVGAVVDASNIFAYNPLTNTTTLTDASGNGNSVTITGAGSSSVAHPSPTTWTEPTITATLNIAGFGDSRMMDYGDFGDDPCTYIADLRPSDTVTNYGISGSEGSEVFVRIRDVFLPVKSTEVTNVCPVLVEINNITSGDSTDTTEGLCSSILDILHVNGCVGIWIGSLDDGEVGEAMTAMRARIMSSGAPWRKADPTVIAALMDNTSADYGGDNRHLTLAGRYDVATVFDAAIDALFSNGSVSDVPLQALNLRNNSNYRM
jgi:hypothetical protein